MVSSTPVPCIIKKFGPVVFSFPDGQHLPQLVAPSLVRTGVLRGGSALGGLLPTRFVSHSMRRSSVLSCILTCYLQYFRNGSRRKSRPRRGRSKFAALSDGWPPLDLLSQFPHYLPFGCIPPRFLGGHSGCWASSFSTAQSSCCCSGFTSSPLLRFGVWFMP
jgi:hypothetical protein